MKSTFIGSLIIAVALTVLNVYDNPKYDFSQSMGTWIWPLLLQLAIILVIWFLFVLLFNRFRAWVNEKGGVNDVKK